MEEEEDERRNNQTATERGHAAHETSSFMAGEEINFSSLRIMSESLRVSEGRRDKNGKRKVDEEQ